MNEDFGANTNLSITNDMSVDETLDREAHPEKYMNVANEQNNQAVETPQTVVETANSDEKPIENVEQKQTTNTVNWDEISGGRIKSPDELNTFFTNHEALKAEREQLAAKYQTVEQSLKEQANPFANEKLYKINHLVKGGMEDTVAARIVGADLENMNHFDRLVLKEIMEKPKYANDEAMIRLDLKDRYGTISVADETELTPEDKERMELNKYRLKRDSEDAVAEIQKMRDAIQVPVVDLEAIQKEKADKEAVLREGWNTVTTDFVAAVKSIPLPIKGGNDKEVKTFMDFTLTDDLKKDYDKQLADFAVSANLPFTDDGMKPVIENFNSAFVLNNLPLIVHSIVTKARAMTTEEYRSQYENPSALENRDTKPKDTTTISEHNAAEFAKFKAAEGL